MKSKYQKQVEANQRREGSIAMYKRTIEEINRVITDPKNRDERVKNLETKIGKLQADIKNTEQKMKK